MNYTKKGSATQWLIVSLILALLLLLFQAYFIRKSDTTTGSLFEIIFKGIFGR